MVTSKRVDKKHTILGLLPLFKAVEEQGNNPEHLLAHSGISLDSMTGSALIDQSQELHIVSEAIDLLQDPLLGIKVGSQVTFASYGTFAMLLMTAANFYRAVETAVQFQPLSLLFSHMTLHTEKGDLEMRYTLPDAPTKLRTFIADRDLMGTYLFIREMVDNAGQVLEGAGTARPRPSDEELRIYRQYIDFDVAFDQPYNWIRLPATAIRQPLKHSNELAHKLYRAQAYELMRKFYPDTDDMVTRIQQIFAGFDSHFPSAKELATMLGISERTIQRHLVESGTSYRALLDEHKRKRALDMLSRKDIPVSELAEALGYAESASFLRAFKRWTGTTPRRYIQNIDSSRHQ